MQLPRVWVRPRALPDFGRHVTLPVAHCGNSITREVHLAVFWTLCGGGRENGDFASLMESQSILLNPELSLQSVGLGSRTEELPSLAHKCWSPVGW
jgi:hypothetical protein